MTETRRGGEKTEDKEERRNYTQEVQSEKSSEKRYRDQGILLTSLERQPY